MALIPAVLLVGLFTAPAQASEHWYLEIEEADIDESVVRRTVALELRDVEIPPRPLTCSGSLGEADGEDVGSLYVRVVSAEQKIIVSLWDRGEYVGRRSISNTGHASVKARRVGLAVAELVRQLGDARKRAIRQHERDLALAEQREIKLRDKRAREALGLRSGVDALWIGEGAWLLGPSVGLDFNGYFPLQFSTRVGWLAGEVPALKDGALGETSPGFSQFDFSFGVAFQHRVSTRTRLSVGAVVVASAVHVSGATEVDGIAGQRGTWSSRLGARLGASRQIHGQVWGHLEFTAGALLRPIPMSHGDEDLRLGGPFLGGSLAITVAP